MKSKSLIALHSGMAIAAMFTVGIFQGCRDKAFPPPPLPTQAQIKALAEKTKQHLVFVAGGEFQMGNFMERSADRKAPPPDEMDERPLHQVRLYDFLIGKYKVTLGDYDLYAAANGRLLPYTMLKARHPDRRSRAHPKSAAFPAGVSWSEAQDYCRWIGKQAGVAMDLPTEAEWEYAARARGRKLVHPTDNGDMDLGRNYPWPVQSLGDDDFFGDFSVGQYPANPLGLHDLAALGFEWTSDWYAADYYSHSPSDNPRGPASGTEKVIRGVWSNHAFAATTFQRAGRMPERERSAQVESHGGYGFRCASHPVAPAKGQQ
ncbi:formylglycine-generating enzyme family protein [Massilia sp. TSP1-1-2]|uniref:formylglycine-generating enzyme family protein n=1 Tax=Massilia sp. TSP1-1-2 TaxID=2804649 RepID=UPI003CF36D17